MKPIGVTNSGDRNGRAIRPGMWRTVARLVRFGEPARAARLAVRLAASLTTSAQTA